MLAIPKRYEPVRRLGQGGGGEVWAVKDRITGEALAFKALGLGAGEGEALALVREAVALTGLEGLGVPRVLAFGSLPDGRRYMVRELIEGESLEDVLENEGGPPWIGPLVAVCDQLTVLHRSGLLHGDIKPANVIVGEGSTGTLVDLGLAAPWREGGARPEGLTPKFAAPELLSGSKLTVRAEVYSLGATLSEALARRGSELDESVRLDLARVAARATQASPSTRYPSVDELASALRRAARMAPVATPGEPGAEAEAAWPIVAADVVAQRLLAAARALEPGGALAVVGPEGSGRTTLVRRMAWTLGVEGQAVAAVAPPKGDMSWGTALALELGPEGAAGRLLVVDDAVHLDEGARRALGGSLAAGARLVAVGDVAHVSTLAGREARAFEVPPLPPADMEVLLRSAMPSLPQGLRAYLVERGQGRPGHVRSMVRKLVGRVVVSTEDIDAALSENVAASPSRLPSRTAESLVKEAERAIDLGRYDEASKLLDRAGARSGEVDGERAPRTAIARARVALGRGDAAVAARILDGVEAQVVGTRLRRTWLAARGRAAFRAGAYAEAARLTSEVARDGQDALTSDALAVGGMALVFTGDEGAGFASLEAAVALARTLKDRRAEGVALGSVAIAHQRAGRVQKARSVYEEALAAAEDARDAHTTAVTRLNLAIVVQSDGDLGLALEHLEAAVDMGQRSGAQVAVQQALLNLANLDLYLGRYVRASASLESLAQQRGGLSSSAQAQLLGLRAELATRTGDAPRGAELYLQCAHAWEEQGRAFDGAEARLEAILARSRGASVNGTELAAELATVEGKLGEGGFGEHQALAEIVRGTVAMVSGQEALARQALDEALRQANRVERREWAWRALDARARLSAVQGNALSARRDTEAALALLEETAAKLPRDLREVFWDDPRRRALRQAPSLTLPVSGGSNPPGLGVGRSSGSMMLGGVRPAEDRLARILELTRELAREHDLARLLTLVTDHAVALLGAERGLVVLVGEGGTLETHTARERSGEDAHGAFSRSVAERVVKAGEPVVTLSARDDSRLAQAVSVHQLMIQSVACVPIRGAPPVGRTIGALYVETRVRPGARFEDELPTLSAFADQAAIAIESARLIAENRARAEELEEANQELQIAKEKLAQTLGRRTEQLVATRRDLQKVRAELKGHFGYGGLVGTSAAMRRLYALIERVKDTDVPVLIIGESGTGKEVVAKAIHTSGARAKRPLLGVNCGAIPENLLESELFGHVRGAFTGADKDRKGLFREAEGGTILLDEIGEMPLRMQAGLLRVLQEKSVRAVGGAHEEPVDVRVLAATNRDLARMVEEGTFREDLYYRLHVIELKIPPLRERVDDIPPLIDHFLTIFATRYRRERKTVEREALRRLCAYPWPGNVRQLEHVLLNAWLMGEGDDVVAEDLELPEPGRPRGMTLPPNLGEGAVAVGIGDGADEARGGRPVTNKAEHKASERERILSALEAANWNRLKAAKLIGVPRRTFYRRLKEFGIL